MGQRSKSIADLDFLPSQTSGSGFFRSNQSGSTTLLCSG
jgi:hypothetical protein